MNRAASEAALGFLRFPHHHAQEVDNVPHPLAFSRREAARAGSDSVWEWFVSGGARREDDAEGPARRSRLTGTAVTSGHSVAISPEFARNRERMTLGGSRRSAQELPLGEAFATS